MKILVTGGAGYIGSHMVLKLLELGYEPIVLDDLSTGLKSFVPANVTLHTFNLNDIEKLNALFAKEKFAAVMHFAAFIEVEESVHVPTKYYLNNFVNTVHLLEAMQKHDVKHLIFSSTAAIFGEPQYVPADENHPKKPINPYGLSKYLCEQIFKDYELAYGIKSISFRYFNAAGADPLLRTGFRPKDASHLIPIVLRAAEKDIPVSVFGTDYDTHDGSCVRDFIHVADLCSAHVLGMQYLQNGGKSNAFNLGNGNGYSVKEVVNTVREVTKLPVKSVDAARRAGDPVQLIANSTLAKQQLGWKPEYAELGTIIEHAWEWHRKISEIL